MNSKNSSGTLVVYVVEAKGLSDKPEHPFRDSIERSLTIIGVENKADTCNPYVCLTVGKKRFKTTVKNDELSPVWNEGPFTFTDVSTTDTLEIKVRDFITIAMGKGHVFGKICIPVKDIPSSLETREFSLEPEKGKPKKEVTPVITLKLQFQSNKLETSPSPPLSPSVKEKTESEEPTEKSNDTQETNNTTLNVQELNISHSAPAVPHVTISRDDSNSTEQSDEVSSSPKRVRGVQSSPGLPSAASDAEQDKEKQSSLERDKSNPFDKVVRKSEELRKNALRAIRQTQSYKQERVDKKNSSFRKLFNLPAGEEVIFDCSAALLQSMLHHGRLYLSQNYLCFYSSVFGIKVVEAIPMSSITSIQKENRVVVNPGITIKTKDAQYHMVSFLNRDKTYEKILSMWNNETPEVEPDESAPEEPTEEEEEGEDGQDPGDDELTALLSSGEDKTGFLHDRERLQEVLSAELPCSVVRFFTLLYSDDADEFTKKYHSIRGDKEVTIERWSSHPEYGTFRTLTYRAPVHFSIGPSSTRLEETQRYHLQKEKLVVEMTSVMHDIPYGDYFRVESMHEVVAIGPDKCKWTCYVGLNFTKKTFFEGKIKSGAIAEVTQSMKTWVSVAEDLIKKSKTKRRSRSLIKDSKAPVPEPDPPLQPSPSSSPSSPEPVKKQTVATPQPSSSSSSASSKSEMLMLPLKHKPPPILLLALFFLMLSLYLFIEILRLKERVAQLEKQLPQV